MNFIRFYTSQFYYFFVLRNKFLLNIYYLYLSLTDKNKFILNKNLERIKDDFDRDLSGYAIVSSNLDFKDYNNILLNISLMNYFKGIGLKPLIFNTYQYYSLFKKIKFLAKKNLACYADISFYELYKLSNQILKGNYNKILNYKYRDISCGKFAISTSMRMLRVAKINLKNTSHKNCVLFNLRKSIQYADAALKFVNENDIRYALFNDRGYCGEGELYETCIKNKIKCVQHIATYKNGVFLIKKFSKNNQNDHPSSISDKDWINFKNKKIEKIQLDYLNKEIEDSYYNNTWYPSAGTMVGKDLKSTNDILKEIGITNNNKIAVIFPHIFWDGTFFYGKDLYDNYEEWYKQTLIIAEKNKNINWIIKSHPSNVVKNKQDKISNKIVEPEEKIIYDLFNKLPENFYYINSNSNINTFYLLNILDFCLTVRGTVALETAMRNKIAITTGTGRYDNKNFTYNFIDKFKYQDTLSNLPNFNKTILNQKENAEKFAYSSLICKNFNPSNLSFYFEPNLYSTLKVNLIEKSFRDNKKLLNENIYLDWLKNESEDFFLDPKGLWEFKSKKNY